MQRYQPWVLGVLVLFGAVLGVTACTSPAALRRLTPAEHAEFVLYHHRMTGAQEHAYLAKSSAVERTAYLREIGVAQRFEALDPLDREAVKSGWPRVGMSAEALRFVWGDPVYTKGDARRSAHWHYVGSSFARGNGRANLWEFGTRVDVYLMEGKVVGWVDVVPTTQDSSDGGWN